MLLSSPSVLALDDGYFPPGYKGGRGRTVLAGIAYKDAPRDVSLRLVVVDGRDATEKAASICRELFPRGPDHVLTDGVTYAGFNFLDVRLLSEECGAPVTAVFRYRPNPGAVWKALRRHFPDHEERWNAIARPLRNAYPLETRRGVVYVYSTLDDRGLAGMVVEATQVYSPLPEPLRIADMVASSAARALLRAGRI